MSKLRLPEGITPYYSEDGITLYCGDCRDILPRIPSGSVDLVLTDPPYGTEALGGGYGRHSSNKVRTISGDADLSLLYATWPDLRRLVTDGWAAIFFADRKAPAVCSLLGGDWYGQIVWDKGSPGLGYHIRYSHECVAILRLGEPERPDIPLLSIIRSPSDPEYHPHQKPLFVIERLIDWATDVDDLVVDPFAGAGTTLVAAKHLGRRAIGIESEERYCAITVDRLRQAVLPLPDAPTPTQLRLEVG